VEAPGQLRVEWRRRRAERHTPRALEPVPPPGHGRWRALGA
jgi:hypothetical protein